MMNGMLILWIVIGFFGLLSITGSLTIWVVMHRRKLIFTNFLSQTGQWERESWLPKNLGKTFVYDNETYNYNIELCTRDRLNRPIAHYYKGNPEQQRFDYKNGSKSVTINTKEITAKDFNVLMLSKVLRDIFQDDEVMQFLMIILIAVGVIGIINAILIITHHPAVVLANDNSTISIIARACKQGITGKVV